MSEVTDQIRERIDDDAYCDLLGIDIVALDSDAARAELVITEDLLNFHGTPHGGAIYSLADAAFAAASNASGETALALETNISYLDTVDVGTTLVAVAEETHVAGRTAAYEVPVHAGNDLIGTFRGRVYRPDT